MSGCGVALDLAVAHQYDFSQAGDRSFGSQHLMTFLKGCRIINLWFNYPAFCFFKCTGVDYEYIRNGVAIWQ